jgi:hypothetical protein
LSVPRGNYASAELPDGWALLLGGGTGIGSSIIEEFDPASETIHQMPVVLTTPRVLATALTLSSRLVMIIGGKTAFGQPPERSTELLDLRTMQISAGPALPLGVGGGHISFLTREGEIVIFRPAADPADDSAAVFIMGKQR